jgi:lipopolysaccharide export system protein LptA
MRFVDRGWLGLLLCCLVAAVQGLESDREQPIYIEADGVEIDEKSGTSLYQGNVLLTQGSIEITAGKVAVTQAGEEDQGQIVAEGNPVTFRQAAEDEGRSVKGRAKRIEYDTDSEMLLMVGDAELVQGGDTFASDRIAYDRARSVVKAGAAAEGKQRVRMTILPKGD